MVKETDIRKATGETVRELRTSKNISQEKLAELSSLDRSFVSEIENGIKTASITTIFKLCLALETKPSQLMELIEKHFEGF